jgi:hypothetical protein
MVWSKRQVGALGTVAAQLRPGVAFDSSGDFSSLDPIPADEARLHCGFTVRLDDSTKFSSCLTEVSPSG